MLRQCLVDASTTSPAIVRAHAHAANIVHCPFGGSSERIRLDGVFRSIVRRHLGLARRPIAYFNVRVDTAECPCPPVVVIAVLVEEFGRIRDRQGPMSGPGIRAIAVAAGKGEGCVLLPADAGSDDNYDK